MVEKNLRIRVLLSIMKSLYLVLVLFLFGILLVSGCVLQKDTKNENLKQESKLQSNKEYEISPAFVLKSGDYSDYNKCNEKICLVCEYHCNVNPNLLDWRFDELTFTYDKLANMFGREKLLDFPITYIIYSKEIEALTKVQSVNGYFVPASTGDFWKREAVVYDPEGLNFKHLIADESIAQDKILHKDYPDKAYAETFENKTTPAHEMLHTVFKARYGGFSYGFIEEQFAEVIGTIIGGKNSFLENKLAQSNISILYNSFCDEPFKYLGYYKLYYLCKEYGFDVNNLPSLFDELDKIKAQNLKNSPENKGKLSNEDFIKAMSIVVGKDVTGFWDK